MDEGCQGMGYIPICQELSQAICSRHFVQWINGGPSAEHPYPELFEYNNWDRNCLAVKNRPKNTIQQQVHIYDITSYKLQPQFITSIIMITVGYQLLLV